MLFLSTSIAYLFEGDLKLSKLELDDLKENTISKRDAVAAKARRWPNARVPFVLSKKFGNLLFSVNFF